MITLVLLDLALLVYLVEKDLDLYANAARFHVSSTTILRCGASILTRMGCLCLKATIA